MQSNEHTRSAAALYYDGHKAPVVTASGRGDVADEIITLAEDNSVPIYENPELSDILVKLELGDEIPEALFVTVAEVIAFVYMIQDKVPENWTPPVD